MSKTPSRPPFSPDWISKTLAGSVLGFTLAMGCAYIVAWLTPDLPLSTRGQLAMWIVAPVWMGTLASVYLFRSGLRAWAWLTGTNVLMLSLVLACRFL